MTPQDHNAIFRIKLSNALKPLHPRLSRGYGCFAVAVAQVFTSILLCCLAILWTHPTNLYLLVLATYFLVGAGMQISGVLWNVQYLLRIHCYSSIAICGSQLLLCICLMYGDKSTTLITNEKSREYWERYLMGMTTACISSAFFGASSIIRANEIATYKRYRNGYIFSMRSLDDSERAIGYVGPACVVVDDLFYLHGHFQRRLNSDEILSFKKYQNTLSLLRQLRDAVSKGATFLNNGSMNFPAPKIPEFCRGLDDTVEVVLDGCTIRGNHVYIADTVVRPVNAIEKQRISTIIQSFSSPSRFRRSSASDNKTTELLKAQTSTQKPFPMLSDELKEFISNTFNINVNVTDRFLPFAQKSPLFTHLVQKGGIFGPRDDAPREPPFVQSEEYAGRAKQKRHGITEVPHIFVDERGYSRSPNYYDPMLIHLLQSLSSRQNINDIVRHQQTLLHQQLQQNAAPQSPQNTMKPGDTTVIGDQTYLAVQLNGEDGRPAVGLVPMNGHLSTHTVTALPPSNWPHYGPAAGIPPNGYRFPHIRHHPPKRVVPPSVNGIPLPHEICRAHLTDPFVWAQR